MKKLYLVRHGQTLFNKKKMIQGSCDSPLTDLGRKQAQAVGSWLEHLEQPPESFYCSMLSRTEETLGEITGGEEEYTRLYGLNEFHYGSLEGESSLQERTGDLPDEIYYTQYGGETRQEVIDRMHDTLQSICENDEANVILAVSHGASSYLFAHSVDPEKAEAKKTGANCVIYDFDYDDGTFILNDVITSHLKENKNESVHPENGLPDM